MKTSTVRDILILSSIVIFLAIPSIARADEVYCEVMSVHGTATVVQNGANTPIKEGGTLKAGDTIQVGQDSYVDIAYDKAWKNVTRIRENSEVKLGSIQPTHLDVKQGDIFSRIKALPKNSSFEVQTPTAVATVRGTEFGADVQPDGPTKFYNVSELDTATVVVSRLGPDGSRLPPIMLDVYKKIEVPRIGEPPLPPQPMSPEEIAKGSADNNELKAKSAFFSGLNNSSDGDNKDIKAKKPGDDDKKLGMKGPGNGPGDSSDSNPSSGNMVGGDKMMSNNLLSYAPAGTTYDPNTGIYTSPNGATYNSLTGAFTPPLGTTYNANSGTYNMTTGTSAFTAPTNTAAPTTTTLAPTTTTLAPTTTTLAPTTTTLAPTTTTLAPTTTTLAPTTTTLAPTTTTVVAPTITYVPPSTTTYVPPTVPEAVQNITTTILSAADRLQQCYAHAQTAADRAACDRMANTKDT